MTSRIKASLTPFLQNVKKVAKITKKNFELKLFKDTGGTVICSCLFLTCRSGEFLEGGGQIFKKIENFVDLFLVD